MTVPTKLRVKGIGWVLPQGTGAGLEILERPELGKLGGDGNGVLDGFTARPYLSSVKGYLDPSSAYLLAATKLALGEDFCGQETGICEDVGLSTVTHYGAPASGFRFYEQFLQKGARHASPLLFPHGYSNTPGNLAAIEFSFAGPHMVFYGVTDPREAFAFACSRLLEGSAKEMLVGCYEATVEDALPDAYRGAILNGAVVVCLTVCGDEGREEGERCDFDSRDVDSCGSADSNGGSVVAFVTLIRELLKGGRQ